MANQQSMQVIEQNNEAIDRGRRGGGKRATAAKAHQERVRERTAYQEERERASHGTSRESKRESKVRDNKNDETWSKRKSKRDKGWYIGRKRGNRYGASRKERRKKNQTNRKLRLEREDIRGRVNARENKHNELLIVAKILSQQCDYVAYSHISKAC
eukprot:scaffold332106_cov58-Attheya_sp.AAC.3